MYSCGLCACIRLIWSLWTRFCPIDILQLLFTINFKDDGQVKPTQFSSLVLIFLSLCNKVAFIRATPSESDNKWEDKPLPFELASDWPTLTCPSQWLALWIWTSQWRTHNVSALEASRKAVNYRTGHWWLSVNSGQAWRNPVWVKGHL